MDGSVSWEILSTWGAIGFLAVWSLMLLGVAVGLARAALHGLLTTGKRVYEAFYVARLKGSFRLSKRWTAV